MACNGYRTSSRYDATVFGARRYEGNWTPGSAHVDGNVESDHPTWVMTAVRGKRRIDLASGPLRTRDIAQRLADTLNRTDVDRWNHFLEHAMRDILSGTWG